jgi:hypothetical protein
VNESAAEPATDGESSLTLCGKIHDPSARQLPTNDDHEGGLGRSSNISVINRRIQPTSAADSFTSETNERIRSDLTRSSVLAGSCHINVLAFSCERQQQQNQMLPRQQARKPARETEPIQPVARRALVSCNAIVGRRLRLAFGVEFSQGTEQASSGVVTLTAVTIVTEVGAFQRFRKPTELMGYTGLVRSEYSRREQRSQGPHYAHWQCAPPARARRNPLGTHGTGPG